MEFISDILDAGPCAKKYESTYRQNGNYHAYKMIFVQFSPWPWRRETRSLARVNTASILSAAVPPP
jgi:hypothetical protein